MHCDRKRIVFHGFKFIQLENFKYKRLVTYIHTYIHELARRQLTTITISDNNEQIYHKEKIDRYRYYNTHSHVGTYTEVK